MTSRRPRLLILPRYGRLGASSRTRLWQYVPVLQAAGFAVRVEPFFSDDYVRDLQAGRRSYARVATAYVRRLAALLPWRPADFVWIEKEAFPWLPLWLERLALPENVPVALDYDDAVFHLYEGHRSEVVRRLLGGKHRGAMRNASLVMAGSRFLADYAHSAGARQVELVPTVVDLHRYSVPARRSARPVPRVCWIGQQATAAFLKPLAPLFAELSAACRMTFTAIGIDATAAGLPMESVEWTEEGEAAAIAACDIGIMPLPDTPFERGKCGYKLIQYMASGLPVVASPVGANRDIVEHGVDGLFAETEEQWREALTRLAANPSLRKQMGKAGRAKVERHYSLRRTAPKVATLLGQQLDSGNV